MLAFMRKHQKYFYVLITFVIVVSFSFFGTYSTLDGNSIREQVAFHTVDGSEITRSELEEMALFISTDREDKRLYGGVWGPNFLNDGVIKKDFLETGLAMLLLTAYQEDLQADLKSRLVKEQRYQPYEHPQAKFINSQNAWAYFAPQIQQNLDSIKQAKDPLSTQALQARIQLFLAERRFPSPYLRQMLIYQEKQNPWIAHDENLDYQDLNLFSYHTLDDWFGPRFSRLIAEFIFNAAAIAEQNGYKVSKEEALTSLIMNAERSFQENQKSPWLGVATSSEYLNQQLIRMHLDKNKAVKLWQKVLLFKKLFNDVGQAVFLDPLAYQTFNQYANQIVTGDLIRLPEALRFSDFNGLIRFETYLDAVAKRQKDEKSFLNLPKTFYTAEEIVQKNPELVRKRYDVEIAKINKKNLQAKVSVKETLAWELEEKNWVALKTQFPELGLKKGDTKEARLATLDKLDPTTKMRVDQFARAKIVESHPEWLKQALDQATMKEQTIVLSPKAVSLDFAGLEHGETLMTLLDQAALNQEVTELQQITFDQENYYKIIVHSRSSALEIMTFEEANHGTLLDDLADRKLEIAYVQMRGNDPTAYQNADKSWKPYKEVREKVALAHYTKLLEAIKTSLKQLANADKYRHLEGTALAPYRFVTPGHTLKQELEKNPQEASLLTVAEEEQASSKDLQKQFSWIRSSLQLARKNDRGLFEAADLFQLPSNSWSTLKAAPNGDLYFAHVSDKASDSSSSELMQEQVAKARLILGSSAERNYALSVIEEIKSKNAISFEFMNAGQTSIEPNQDDA